MLSAILTLVAAQLPTPPAPSTVMATVNGQPITAGEIAPLLWDSYGYMLAQEVAFNRLLRAEAKKHDIRIDPTEISSGVDVQIRRVQASLPEGVNLNEAFRERGISRTRIEMAVESDLLAGRLTALEMKPADFVKVSTFGLKPASASSADLQTVIQQMDAAYNRLQKGDPWTTVLRETAKDPAFVNNDGALGWRSIDNFPETMRESIRGLTKGQSTKPMQTPYGIQIFRVDLLGADATVEDLAVLKGQFVATHKTEFITRLRQSGAVKLTWPQ